MTRVAAATTAVTLAGLALVGCDGPSDHNVCAGPIPGNTTGSAQGTCVGNNGDAFTVTLQAHGASANVVTLTDPRGKVVYSGKQGQDQKGGAYGITCETDDSAKDLFCYTG